jgi:hypothetical protein
LVLVFEELAGKSEDFAVSRMVESLYTLDLGFERGRMAFDMVYENGLLVGRSSNQDGSCVGQTVGDLLQESMILWRMPAANGIRLVVNVADGVLRVHDDDVRLRRAEVKDAGFVVIDPNNRVKMA